MAVQCDTTQHTMYCTVGRTTHAALINDCMHVLWTAHQHKYVTVKCGYMCSLGQYILRSAVNTACSGCSIAQTHTSNVSTKSFLERSFNSGVLRRTEHSPPLPSYTHSPAHLQQERRHVEWQSCKVVLHVLCTWSHESMYIGRNYICGVEGDMHEPPHACTGASIVQQAKEQNERIYSGTCLLWPLYNSHLASQRPLAPSSERSRSVSSYA